MGLFNWFKKEGAPSPKQLTKAARKGDLQLVNSLLEKGADVNGRNGDGETPLICASFGFASGIKECLDIIKTLRGKGADINARDNKSLTALIYAAANGWVDTLKVLIEAGADLNIKSEKGRTALIFAADYGWIDASKILMEAGAQMDDKDRDEVMALINGRALPPPLAQPPLPEFATKHDLSLVVEVEKSRMELEISADACFINWGDGSAADERKNIKEKNISHRYPKAGVYTITINASGLSMFKCWHLDANATAIYLNNCPQLEKLYCYLNKLASLDISRCPALKHLSCGNNKLASLDISNNPALEYLSCENNLLAWLDIGKNTKLRQVDCSHNRLTMLNVGRDGAIARLMCDSNQLSKIELHRAFNQLPNYNSSYGTVNSWYAGSTSTPTIFFTCGDNPGFVGCNKKIAQNKHWLVWKKAMYIPATLAGTPARWTEDYR